MQFFPQYNINTSHRSISCSFFVVTSSLPANLYNYYMDIQIKSEFEYTEHHVEYALSNPRLNRAQTNPMGKSKFN